MLEKVNFKKLYKTYGATINIALIIVAVKLVAFYKEVLIADVFGTGDDLEAFLFALLIATFLANLVCFSFISAFIPKFVELDTKFKDKKEAKKLAGDVLVSAMIISFVVAIILYSFGSDIIEFLTSSFSGEKQFKSYQLLVYLLPIIVLDSIATIYSSILEAKGKFSISVVAQVFKPLCIVALLLISNNPPVESLAIGWLIGSFLTVIYLGALLYGIDYLVFPKWSGINNDNREVFKQYGFVAIGALVISGMPIIDQTMATWVGAGVLARLSFGNKIIAMVLGIAGPAITKVIFPYISEYAVAGKKKRSRKSLSSLA